MITFEATTNFDITEDWAAAEIKTLRFLKRIGVEMREMAIAILRREGSKASGDLIDSIDEEVWQTPDGFTLEMGPTVSYGLFVETGTRPHWMPIDPLKKWARDKFGLVGKEKDALAYAVQHKIAREGTDPVPYIEETFRFFLPIMAKRLAGAYG